jgi:hypothetical protein
LRLQSENNPGDEEIGGMSRKTLAPIFDDPDRGLSNREFAAAIGVHPSTVTRYRAGKITIPVSISREWEIRGDRWYRKRSTP